MSVLLWAYIFVGCVVVTKDVDAALSYFYSFDHTYLFAIKSELTNICNCVHFDIFTAWKPLQTVLVIILQDLSFLTNKAKEITYLLKIQEEKRT